MTESSIAPPSRLKDIVARFADHLESYRAGRYNETQIRREFLDPFFRLLGWDVDNEQGYAEAYKDVIHEDAIKIGGASKAPDYCFRIGGTRKFFVEAKKPSVDIKGDPGPAYQLRRYAWSAKLPLSILTDFEEFAVYDCRIKPHKNDSASTARILYFRFTDYVDQWEKIASIFSREALLKGSFDKYADSTKRKRGTAEVDDAFLEEIEQWRDVLARNFALRNPDLGQRDLNFAVQRTIDRILFLRICEDRGIEDYGTLQELLQGKDIYPRLFERFLRADERYNSGLFHFSKEKGRTTDPDELTPGLGIDDKVLKGILARLYYPDCPYEFSVLPADILGQVYERFLGKVIRLTKGHQAKVEEKPEVRKAGGVYYTPTYIVDYIVRETVGKLAEGMSPQEVGGLTRQWRPSSAKGAHPIRVLDPACGSGSFLLGAYQFLLDWYRDRYIEEGPERHARGKQPRLHRHVSGEWRLTTGERKRILLSHIHGVDIDPQAVEVTKLSLLLKVLEGESEATLDSQLRLFQERALPDLGDNIKCGNSLIGPDFYENQEMDLFDDEERYRINAFDWQAEFPEVFGDGGFDAVIGNPPYIRIQTMKESAPHTVDYYNQRFNAAGKGNYDIYVLFPERGLHLLHHDGRLGFILPHKFFNARYGRPLRGLISRGKRLAHVVHFGDQQVFSGATTYTCLLFLLNRPCDSVDFVEVKSLEGWRAEATAQRFEVPADKFTADDWNVTVGSGADMVSRLSGVFPTLGDFTDRIAQGIRTSANEVYVLDLVGESGRFITAFSKPLQDTVKLERDAVSPFLQGREIKPYSIHPSGKVVIIPYEFVNGGMALLEEVDYRKRFPNAYDYLVRHRRLLEQREKGRMRGDNWYGYVYPKNLEVMESPKILVPDIADRAAFALDEAGVYAFTSGYGIILGPEVREASKYVLGLLNSRVLDRYLKQVSTRLRGGFFRYFAQYLAQLPIRPIDFDDPSDRARHDKMVCLVQRMLDLHQRLAAARTAHQQTVLQRDIRYTDQRIDRLVYELYGLTGEEIRIVEEGDG